MNAIPRTVDEATALFASVDPEWVTSLQVGLGTLAAFAAAFAILLAVAVLVSGR